MTGPPRAGSRGLLPVTLLLASLLALPGPALALPGDLTVDMSLTEDYLEAAPEEEADEVVLHGNVTFEQPFYQYASASLTVDLSRNWTVEVAPSTVENRGSGTRAFTVTVEVPTTASGGEEGALLVNCEYSTRLGDPSTISEGATVRVRPWIGYRVNLTGPAELVLPQGGSGELRVPLRNVGNMAETFSGGVPFWYGLRPRGLTVDTPMAVDIPAKGELELGFPVTVAAMAVPRTYVFDLRVDASHLQRGGEEATEDPRTVRAEVHVVGDPPPDDPYQWWAMGDPPDAMPRWKPIFTQTQRRHHPDVGPDGKRIVYDQYVETDRVICTGDITGSGAQRLTHGHYDHHPVFSPNGQMIAFARSPDRILVINLNGTELMEFGTELGGVNITDWSPSGDRLLMDSGGNIYELDIRTNTTYRLAGDPVDQWGAVYSPDGGTVYYLSEEAAGVHAEVFSMGSDGSNHRQLTFNEHLEHAVSVSPNGRRIAFLLSEPDIHSDRVCVMATDGSDVRPFTDRNTAVYALRWHPDGMTVIAAGTPINTSDLDIMRVSYPWDDAGIPQGNGGGGGAGGADETLRERLMALWNPYACSALLIAVVVIVAFIVLGRRRGRERAAAAEELRRLMEEKERTGGEGTGREDETMPLPPMRSHGTYRHEHAHRRP